MSELLYIDFNQQSEKAILFRALSGLRGMYSVEIKSARRLRSPAQNRLYHSVYVHAFRRFLNEQGQPYTADFCHKLLAGKFLAVSAAHPVTGEFIGTAVRSTTELSTKEFNEYLDNVQAYLAETFGITLPTIGEFTGESAHA